MNATVAKVLYVVIALSYCTRHQATKNQDLAPRTMGSDTKVKKDQATSVTEADSEDKNNVPPLMVSKEANAKSSVKPIKPSAFNMPEDPCSKFPPTIKTLPVFIESSGFFVTRLLKNCLTRDGESGYEKNTAFMTMGVPCSADQGKIEIKGTSYSPKLLIFHLALNCPMKPLKQDEVKEVVKKVLSLSDSARLIAINPMMVQYWELKDFKLYGFGSQVEWVLKENQLRIWHNFIAKKAQIAITFYGRENVFGAKDVYQIDGELASTAERRFYLKQYQAKVLSSDEKNSLKEKCLKIASMQNCGTAFD